MNLDPWMDGFVVGLLAGALGAWLLCIVTDGAE
jgi:hypothetical protein